MSQFECPVVRVTIESHPNADAIELARVGGYLSVVKKGQFQNGELAVYIPEQAVLPPWLLESLGFWDEMNGKGKLSGSRGNRVRAMKLRGVLSQGLLVPLIHDTHEATEGDWLQYPPRENGNIASRVHEDQDVADLLGVIKYEPVVPQSMAGRVAGGDLDATIGYDFENLKKFPTLFEDGQEVVITEKLHGTCLQVGLVTRAIWEGKSWAEKCLDFGDYKGIVTSKGQGAKGLMLDPSDEGNLYVRIAKQQALWEKLFEVVSRLEDAGVPPMPIFIFGEVFGAGVQDLAYGQVGQTFCAFDMYQGTRSDGMYVGYEAFEECCLDLSIPTVPVLYRGPYSAEVVAKHTDGNTTFDTKQIREGVVVRSVLPSHIDPHPRYGRRIAKSVSAAYLTRKGEVTEFQ
jgi:RNA ligase (TIGR02306 family)